MSLNKSRQRYNAEESRNQRLFAQRCYHGNNIGADEMSLNAIMGTMLVNAIMETMLINAIMVTMLRQVKCA